MWDAESRGQGRSLHRSSIQAFTPQSLQLSHSRLLKEPNHSPCPFFSLSAAQVSQWSWPIHLLVAHLNLKCMQNTWPHAHKRIYTRTPYVSRLETSHRHLKKIYFHMWALLGLALSKNVIGFNYSAHELNYRSIKLKQDSSGQALQSASTHIVCLIITLINQSGGITKITSQRFSWKHFCDVKHKRQARTVRPSTKLWHHMRLKYHIITFHTAYHVHVI